MVWHIQKTSKEIFHVFYMFQNPLVIDGKLDEDEIGVGGDVKGEAEGEVVGTRS